MASDPRPGSVRPYLELPRAQREQVLTHAAGVYPEECCGFLIGRFQPGGRRVTRVEPAPNRHPSARRRAYLLSPESFLAADRSAREEGFDVVGFYHSHPDGSTAPSETDRRAALPEASYLIVSVVQGRPDALASWTLGRGDSGFLPEILRDVPEEDPR